jgi:hypothetical protein
MSDALPGKNTAPRHKNFENPDNNIFEIKMGFIIK